MILLNIIVDTRAQLMNQFSDISLIEDILSVLSHVLIFFLFKEQNAGKKDEFR